MYRISGRRGKRIPIPFELANAMVMVVRTSPGHLVVLDTEAWDTVYRQTTDNGKLRLNYMSNPAEIKERMLYIDRRSSMHLGKGHLAANKHSNRIEIYNTTLSSA